VANIAHRVMQLADGKIQSERTNSERLRPDQIQW
jgi:hypothetical protein